MKEKKERDWKFIIGMVVLVAIFAVMGGAFWNMVGKQAQIVKEEEQEQEANAISAIYIETGEFLKTGLFVDLNNGTIFDAKVPAEGIYNKKGKLISDDVLENGDKVKIYGDGITVLLLCCFFMSAYVLSRSRKFLVQLVKDFLLNRERTSIFAATTATDMRYMLLLILQTCVLASVCTFNYFVDVRPELGEHVSPYVLLGGYLVLALLYLFWKWVTYSFLGWIFFDASRTGLWMESYSTLLYYLGFTLFPFALFLVYFDLSLQATVIIGLFLVFFTKILMLYKWIKLFCGNLYGILLLILYFCALEIIPCFIMYRGVLQLNDYLIINF